MKNLRYEDPYRPPFELRAAVVWLLAAVLLSLWATLSEHGLARVGYIYASLSLVFVLVRAWQGSRVVIRRRRLSGHELTFMSVDELRRKMKRCPDALWLGQGFGWGTEHRQLLHQIEQHSPEELTKRDDGEFGVRYLHGLHNGRDSDLYVPLRHLDGHTLIAGTTGAGKTRMVDTMMTQLILRGESVVVIDAKGDADLREVARRACRLSGRELVEFHPAFPERSARINPLANWLRPTELATRIATLIPSETGGDPFTAFGQMAMNTIIQALLMVGREPTLVDIRYYLQHSQEDLVKEATQTYFRQKMGAAERAWKPYIAQSKTLKEEALGMMQFYGEQVRRDRSLSDVRLDALHSLFKHPGEHFGKMVASLLPILDMLTSGSMRDLMSPRSTDLDDNHEITDLWKITSTNRVAYIALDSLSDSMVGSAIGSMLLGDLAAVAGKRYNQQQAHNQVNLIFEEASEYATDQLTTLLNKARGAKMRCFVLFQTLSDIAARLGSRDKAQQQLGNCNNKIILRVINVDTQEYLTDTLRQVPVRTIEYSQNTRSSGGLDFQSTNAEALKEEEVSLIPAPMLGQLPNLEFFAEISGGRMIKSRLPILTSDDDEEDTDVDAEWRELTGEEVPS